MKKTGLILGLVIPAVGVAVLNIIYIIVSYAVYVGFTGGSMASGNWEAWIFGSILMLLGSGAAVVLYAAILCFVYFSKRRKVLVAELAQKVAAGELTKEVADKQYRAKQETPIILLGVLGGLLGLHEFYQKRYVQGVLHVVALGLTVVVTVLNRNYVLYDTVVGVNGMAHVPTAMSMLASGLEQVLLPAQVVWIIVEIVLGVNRKNNFAF